MIGASSPTVVEDWNAQPYEKPYQRMRDSLRFLRAALAGERIDSEYETFSVRRFQLAAKLVNLAGFDPANFARNNDRRYVGEKPVLDHFEPLVGQRYASVCIACRSFATARIDAVHPNAVTGSAMSTINTVRVIEYKSGASVLFVHTARI